MPIPVFLAPILLLVIFLVVIICLCKKLPWLFIEAKCRAQKALLSIAPRIRRRRSRTAAVRPLPVRRAHENLDAQYHAAWPTYMRTNSTPLFTGATETYRIFTAHTAASSFPTRSYGHCQVPPQALRYATPAPRYAPRPIRDSISSTDSSSSGTTDSTGVPALLLASRYEPCHRAVEHLYDRLERHVQNGTWTALPCSPQLMAEYRGVQFKRVANDIVAATQRGNKSVRDAGIELQRFVPQ